MISTTLFRVGDSMAAYDHFAARVMLYLNADESTIDIGRRMIGHSRESGWAVAWERLSHRFAEPTIFGGQPIEGSGMVRRALNFSDIAEAIGRTYERTN